MVTSEPFSNGALRDNVFPGRRLQGLIRERTMVMNLLLQSVWRDDEGQDIAEYAVMLAVILVIVVGTIRLIGTNANTIFSETASSLQ